VSNILIAFFDLDAFVLTVGSYYGYLSSQVYSTDMFYSVFKNDPMNAKEGRRYRHTVLERGVLRRSTRSLGSPNRCLCGKLEVVSD
jgi:hypothetical protein